MTLDTPLLILEPRLWRHLRDYSLFVVAPPLLFSFVAFPQTLGLLWQPGYLFVTLVLLYTAGFLRFQFVAPKRIRLTEHRIDLYDRTDNLKERSIRWVEIREFRRKGGWTPHLWFRTFQDRTYRIPNLGLSTAEWKDLENHFRRLALAQGAEEKG